MAKKDTQLLLLHGTISLASLFAIVFFNSDWAAAIIPKPAAPEMYTVDLGVEHTSPITFGIDVSALNDMAIIELTHKEGEETIAVSVPETWVRREVRNATIEEVTADSSAFGFTRWQLPSGAILSFRVPRTPEKIILHNPSQMPMKVEIARVDLEKESVEKDIVLIQEASAELW